ncbi:hypothetical protein [Nocardia sp. NPDC020380]|uniref:hypothetical protein n=1 Tax=Nocardia sp. NPDC020380 TaxID=3364309 RepID=UPI00378E8800
MSLRTLAVAVTTAAVGVSAVLVAAAPADAAPDVSYHAVLQGKSVVATLEGGTFALSGDGAVQIADADGRVLDSLPLTGAFDGRGLSIRPQLSADEHTLTLTPEVSPVAAPVLQPVASPVENQLAMNDLINAVSISTSVGSLIGTAIGAVAGIGVGLALAGASCVVLSLGCVVAVLPIVTVVGAVGGIAGLVLAGGPATAVAAFNYFSTLNAAPGTSIYASQVPGLNH